MEAWVLTFLMCFPGANSPDDCGARMGRFWHPTESACQVEFIQQALPWVESLGAEIIEVDCVMYSLPLLEGDPT